MTLEINKPSYEMKLENQNSNNQRTNNNQSSSIFDNYDSGSGSSSASSLADILSYSLKDDPIDKLFGKKKKAINPANFGSTNTQDGTITGTYQQGTGDCWLLAGVNSLSYTDEGRKIIKDALDYQENGNTVVHLKGAGDYTVTKDEIEAIKKQQAKGSGQYSVGDDDMLIMEIAIQKCMNDIATKKIKWASNVPAEYERQQELASDMLQYKNSITGGQITELMYLITGKQTEYISNKNGMSNALNNYDSRTSALGAAMRNNKTVTDINGNRVDLVGCHAYSIKNVVGDTVTVVNPWDSSQEIVLSRSTFMNAFDNISKCDLSNNNPNVNLIEKPFGYTPDGGTIYVEQASSSKYKYNGGGKFTNDKGEEVMVDKIKQVYDEDGNLKELQYLDEEGNVLYEVLLRADNPFSNYLKEFENQEKAEEKENENKSQETKISITPIGNGDSFHYELRKYDADGNLLESVTINSTKVNQKELEKDLINNQKLSMEEIKKYVSISGSEFQEK